VYFPFFDGDCFHQGMDWFYRRVRPHKVLANQKEYVANELKNFEIPESIDHLVTQHRAQIYGMTKGYMDSHKREPLNVNVKHVEQSFCAPLLDTGISLIGTVDLAIQVDDMLYIMDHKTCSAINQPTIDNLFHDLQVQTYQILVEACQNTPVGGIIYNMVKKPAIRQKNSETFDEFLLRLVSLYTKEPEPGKTNPYFHRETVHANEADRQENFTSLMYWVEQMFNMHDRPEHDVLDPSCWPKNEKNCGKYGSNNMCSKWHLCKGHAKGSQVDQIGFQKSSPKPRGDIIYSKEKLTNG